MTTIVWKENISCSMCGKFLCWSKEKITEDVVCNNCKVYLTRRTNSLVSQF